MAKLIIGAVAAVALVLLLVTSYQQVDAGHRGVLLTFGGVDTTESLQEGAHFVVPLVQKVEQMEVRTLIYVSDNDSASKDLQTVSTEVTVNYRPDPETIQILYKELGIDYQHRIINPAVEEVIKQVTANYNAEELITKRPIVKNEITDSITNDLREKNISVEGIFITDFQFSPEFTKAIEAKVTVQQEALKAENLVVQKQAEALQKEAIAEGNKLAKIQEAQGVKQSKILVSEGNALAIEIESIAEAEALERLAAAIEANPDLLKLKWIQQWNGGLPSTLFEGGDQDTSVLMNLPATTP